MLILDNGDKIQGDASAASVVDYTIHGMSGTTLSQLADGQLATETGDLYPASAIVVIKTIILVNTDTLARTLNLYLLPSGGTARRILAKDVSLAAGYSLHFDGKSVAVLNTVGAVIFSYINHVASHEDGGSDELDCAGLANRINMVSRGYFTAHDFVLTDFITDDTWRELDLSAIVPAGAKFVQVKVTLQDDAVDSILSLKKTGTPADNKNTVACRTMVADVSNYIIFFVECDSDRKIDYRATEIVWSGGIWLNILGWMI